MSKGSSGSGCAALFVVVFLIGIVMWILAAALWLVGVVVAIGAIVGAGMLIAYAWKGVAAQRESSETAEEIELLAQDSVRDLRNLEFRWSDAVLTKGIGTVLEERLRAQPSLAEAKRREIEAMIILVEQAPGTEQRLEAVSKAEALRIRIEALMAP
ncbi:MULTISPECIES: hypothetical protein [Corynebacterium]|uniref:hypothetical protein n=1 Tax=Corynebacterium TaxID=1716 RepID=UPI00257B9B56|nr:MULTISPECIES: hypothetical protein [Corynebacterium]